MIGMRSCGKPGAALMWNPGVLTPGTAQHGLAEVSIFVTLLESMPKRLSSDSEVHWMFSFHDRFVGDEIMSIGITPLGAIHAVAPDGTTATSAAGAIVPDGKEREVRLTWIGFGAIGLLQCPGVAPIAIGAAGPTQYAIPTTAGTFMLFNGKNLIANNNLFMRKANLTFLSSADAPCYLEWAFTEGSGDTVAPTITGDHMLDGFDLTLERRMVDDYPQAWPDVDLSENPGALIRWVRRTEYRRITRAATKYRRRSASWLS